MADVRTAALVGRDRELNQLDAMLRAALAGSFRAMIVHGPPGIGKTRLLAALLDQARGRGLAIHSGYATEFERDVPFGVYAAAFEPPDRSLDDLAELIAGFTGSSGAAAVGVDRYHLFHRIRRALERRAAATPTLLLLDDLHWADQSSLELSEYLLRRPLRAGLVLAIAHRSGQAPPGLADAAVRLGDAARVLGLDPLTTADLAELIPGQSPLRRRVIYQISGGNPLYAKALAAASDDTLAALAGKGDGCGSIDQALVDVLSTELNQVSPEARHIARAAAVAGDHVGLELVERIADRRAAAAVDELSRCGIVTVADSRLVFRHPLLRAAAYWSSQPGWRLAAHARAAAFLRERQGPLQLLAHHTMRSASHGDGAAVDTLVEAGVAALHTAPVTAAQLLQAAVRLLPDRPDQAARRTDVQMALARALGMAGRLDESRQLLQEVMRVPDQRRMEAVAFASVVCRLRGQFDEASALLTTEVARSPGKGRRAAHALVELAAVELARKRPDGARVCAWRALGLVSGPGNPALECAAYALLALCHLQRGETSEASRYADRSAWLLDGASDAVVLPYIEAVAPLAWVETHLQRYAAAARHVGRGTEIAERNGRSHSLPYLLIVAAVQHLRLGRLDEAVSAATEAQEVSRLIHSSETLAMAAALPLRAVLWREGPKAALDLAATVAAMERPRSGWWCEVARLDLAAVYLAAGRAGACLAELDHGWPAADPARPELAGGGHDADVAAYAWALRAVATVELRSGEPSCGDARDFADRAVALASDIGLSHQLGAAYRARARVQAAHGSYDDAVRDAVAAAAYFADAGASTDEATTRHLAGVLLGRAGRPRAAAAEMTLAKRLYAACGMAWYSVDLARDERRLAASRPRQSRSQGGAPAGGPLAALTAREREVAELASVGLTNREIADRLCLSNKTVEAHMSRTFTKLGVHSRVALTRWLTAELRSGTHPSPRS